MCAGPNDGVRQAHVELTPDGDCHFGDLDIPELRSWVVDGHCYVIFYVERAEDIDVWRILHGQRDLPGVLRSPD
jgi:toxin ParE1/3/4